MNAAAIEALSETELDSYIEQHQTDEDRAEARELDATLDAAEARFRSIAKTGTLAEVARALALYVRERDDDEIGPSDDTAVDLANRAIELTD